VKLARLTLGPNWDPEPGGWRRMAAMLRNEDKIQLNVFPTGLGKGVLAAATIAHLTGTTDSGSMMSPRSSLKASSKMAAP